MLKFYCFINKNELMHVLTQSLEIVDKKWTDDFFGKYALSADITNRVYLFEVEWLETEWRAYN